MAETRFPSACTCGWATPTSPPPPHGAPTRTTRWGERRRTTARTLSWPNSCLVEGNKGLAQATHHCAPCCLCSRKIARISSAQPRYYEAQTSALHVPALAPVADGQRTSQNQGLQNRSAVTCRGSNPPASASAGRSSAGYVRRCSSAGLTARASAWCTCRPIHHRRDLIHGISQS